MAPKSSRSPAETWRAARVFVNNAPDQWHVTTGKKTQEEKPR